ncbi:MAG: GDYXXLXY domain-containing protein [Hyphomicrobiaceae bacterium]|nr:GDYXXLXY domain-containing protein [Hyphomicrobiaceae bacterium]
MTPLLKLPIASYLASALLLTAALGYLVVDRVRLLTTGREIVLPIVPVDPRDLFKGDYARLAFEISRLDQSLAPEPDRNAGPPFARPPMTVYVTLEQRPDGTWGPIAVSSARPTTLDPGKVVLRGRTQPWSRRDITYGLERYFVPEGTGRRIEDLAQKSKLAAIVAVDSSGGSAIKGLLIDGRRVYEEPLF